MQNQNTSIKTQIPPEDSKTTHVLDYGFVQLIDHLGDDERICNAARVSLAADASFNHNQPRSDKDNNRLISYLLSHGHTSPFEQVEFVFVVQAPIFVIRQWFRHRTWSYNEISARYTELPPTQMYLPESKQVHHKSNTIKQGRGEELSEELKQEYLTELAASYELARQSYNHFTTPTDALCPDPQGRVGITNGLNISREIARAVLPVSVYSRFYAKVDLNNLLKFINLRMKSNAQYEIQKYAQVLLELIKPIVPLSVAAWEKYVFYAKRFNQKEAQTLKKVLEFVDSYLADEKFCEGLKETLGEKFRSKLKNLRKKI